MSRPVPVIQSRTAVARILSPTFRAARESLRRVRSVPEIQGLIRHVRPYTMVPDEDLLALAERIDAVHAAGMPGAFVECGTWRGGTSFLMALLLDRRGDWSRRVWMFDSFEGLPPTTDEDGATGRAWDSGNLRGLRERLANTAAEREDVERWASELGVRDRLEIVQGWFSETLPVHAERIGPIALLRLDGDLYDSTRDCLEHLWDRVVPGGLVILDDYLMWEGCARAVHEFLGRRSIGAPILPLGRGENVAIRKP